MVNSVECGNRVHKSEQCDLLTVRRVDDIPQYLQEGCLSVE